MTEKNSPNVGGPLNYPSNSHKAKEEKPAKEEKKIQRVTSNDPVQRKPSLGKRIAETFSGDDMRSVGQYILFEVVIPAAKTMLSEAMSQGTDRLLWGDSRSGSRRGTAGAGSRTPYNRMYSRPTEQPRQLSSRARATHDFDDIVIANRGEAEEVLERLTDLVDSYDVASVSDLYELVGITGNFTDDKWGWYDMRGSSVVRVRDGWLLSLPKTQPIE